VGESQSFESADPAKDTRLLLRGFTSEYAHCRFRSEQRSHCGRFSLHFFFCGAIREFKRGANRGPVPSLYCAKVSMCPEYLLKATYQCIQPFDHRSVSLLLHHIAHFDLTSSRSFLGFLWGGASGVNKHPEGLRVVALCLVEKEYLLRSLHLRLQSRAQLLPHDQALHEVFPSPGRRDLSEMRGRK